MTSDRPALDRLLDAFVFAPLGLLLTARDHLPQLADEGRRRLGAQAGLARMVGEMAVSQGRRQVAAAMERHAAARAATAPTGSGDAGGSTDPEESAAHDSAAGSAPRARSRPMGVAGAPRGAPQAPDAAGRPSPDDLAIPGYDSLSASQVVQRLAGLPPADLERVRAYESAGRARKTILLRISQLGA